MSTPLVIEIFTKSVFKKSWQLLLNKLVWDLTLYTGKLQIRDKPDGTVLIEFVTGTNMTLSDQGVVEIVADIATTSAQTWKTGVWDLLLTAPGDEAERIFGGTAKVTVGVTE